MLTLVLLPGLDGSGDLFKDFIAALDPKLKPLVVPYPRNRPLGYQELIEHVRSRLPQNQPYVILAESFAGPIGIALAASRPPGLAGLVLSCSFARSPLSWTWLAKRLFGWLPVRARYLGLAMPFMFGRYVTAAQRQAVQAAVTQTTDGILRHRLGEVLEVDYLARLKDIEVPVLYLQASEDRIVPRSVLQELALSCPRLQSITLQGPHMLLQVMPQEVASIVAKYIQGTVASSSAWAGERIGATVEHS
jgi:pimeloyl-[acyl-carrier protein] methyl ester esterase